MAKDYPYIRANGKRWGSSANYIEDEVKLARADKAPADAWAWTWEDASHHRRTWRTVSELERQCATNLAASETLRKLRALV
jgi:hypothetical protein